MVREPVPAAGPQRTGVRTRRNLALGRLAGAGAGHRPERPGHRRRSGREAPGRHLDRHPVQVLRARPPSHEGRRSELPCRLAARGVRAAVDRGHLPLGPGRREPHPADEHPPHRLPRLPEPPGGRQGRTPGPRALGAAAGGDRQRPAGARASRPRPPHHGLRHRQDVHRAAHRGALRAGRRVDPVPCPDHRAGLAGAPRVADPQHEEAGLPRRLLRSLRRRQERTGGHPDLRARMPRRLEAGRDRGQARRGPAPAHEGRLQHLPVAHASRRGAAGTRRRALRADDRRRGAPDDRRAEPEAREGGLPARSRRGTAARRQAPVHDGHAAHLHPEVEEPAGEAGDRGRRHGRRGDLRAPVPPPPLQDGRGRRQARGLSGHRARRRPVPRHAGSSQPAGGPRRERREEPADAQRHHPRARRLPGDQRADWRSTG